MATKGHENEAVKVEGLSASLQKFKDDLIGIPNQSDAVYYTQAEADAYNALLTGALNSTDPLTAEEAAAYNEVVPLKVADNTLSEAESVAYNAQLTGALDSISPLTAEQAAAYTEAFPDDPMEEGDTLSEEQAEAYNAQLTDALDHTTPLTAEQAAAFNTAFPAKETGDTLLAFQANAYNATLDGAINAGDVKTPAVPNKVKDYVDDRFVPRVYGVATNLAAVHGAINPMLPEAISHSSIALDGYIGMGSIAGGDFNQISSVIKPSPSGDLKYTYIENNTWTDHKMWHEGNDGSGSGLDADLLDGLDSGNFARKYFYSIPHEEGVRIYCGDTYGALVFGRSTSGATHHITLIGTGYSSTAGSGRNHWKCIDRGGSVSWTNASTTARCVEIMYTHTAGDLKIYVISPMSTVTFTKITELSGDANTDVVAMKSQIPTDLGDLTNTAGYTKNTGTITGIKMNGASKGTSGVVDLGTVITAHQDISGKQDKVAKLGSKTQPVYTSAAGTFAACTTYAGGTKVTLNGESYAGEAATFYAPAGAGSEGQVLVSSGSGAPTWGYPRVNKVVTRSSIKGAVTINANSGTLQILNLTGNITGMTVSNAQAGETIHVVCHPGSTARSVAISHTDTYICPHGTDALVQIDANGACHLVFSYDGTKFFVDWY